MCPYSIPFHVCSFMNTAFNQPKEPTSQSRVPVLGLIGSRLPSYESLRMLEVKRTIYIHLSYASEHVTCAMFLVTALFISYIIDLWFVLGGFWRHKGGNLLTLYPVSYDIQKTQWSVCSHRLSCIQGQYLSRARIVSAMFLSPRARWCKLIFNLLKILILLIGLIFLYQPYANLFFF